MLGRAGLQGDGRQRGAQLVGHVGSELALALGPGLQRVDQGVDGRHGAEEFAEAVLRVQPLAGKTVQRLDLAGEAVERAQATPDGPPQHQGHQRQHQDRGLRHVLGNILAELEALVHVHQRQHAALAPAHVQLHAVGAPFPHAVFGLERHGGKPVRGHVAQVQARRHAVGVGQQAAVLPGQHGHVLHVLVIDPGRFGDAVQGGPGGRRFEPQTGHPHQLSIGELAGLTEPGGRGHGDQREPHHQQGAQCPAQDVAAQHGLARGPRHGGEVHAASALPGAGVASTSRGMK
ncbi:hypothetical protein FQZ97_726260 [compost metagenome]